MFQHCPFSVMLAVFPYCFISSRVFSIHFRLGRPILLFPGTATSIMFLERLYSSLLLMCPYQFNLFCQECRQLAEFCMLLYDLVSDMILSGLIPLSIVASSFPLNAIWSRLSYWPPNTRLHNVIVGLLTVLYTLSFSLMGTVLSRSTLVRCFQFIQASFTRLLMSLPVPPFESNIDPK